MELYIIKDEMLENNGLGGVPELHKSNTFLRNLYVKNILTLNNKLLENSKTKNSDKMHYIDSGFDIFIPENNGTSDITSDSMSETKYWKVLPNSTIKIPLGIKMIRTDGYYHRDDNQQNPFNFMKRTMPFYIYPRSSISKTPLRLANSVGIIDSGYRGELIAVFDNISDYEYIILPGTRLVQTCLPDLIPFSVKLVDNDFPTTERGDGGFGSTGV
jgi:dUTP pyrophosphatase